VRQAATILTPDGRTGIFFSRREALADFGDGVNGVPACRETGFLTSYDYFDINAAAAATLRPGKNFIAAHCRQTSGGQFIDVGIVDRK
jgi:hypothetical protein